MKRPFANEAEVPRAKIVLYLLNPEHRSGKGKARFFASHGFAVEDWQKLAAAVLAVPGVAVNYSITERIIWHRVREAMRRQRSVFERLNQTPVNLTLLRPAILRKNILLIEAIHDLRAPKEDIERLWQAWAQPDIWRLPHGHHSWIFTPGLTRRVFDWLAPRLEAGRKNNE